MRLSVVTTLLGAVLGLSSVAAWYLCPDAPDIADYIDMCNQLACEEVSSCLDGRPDC